MTFPYIRSPSATSEHAEIHELDYLQPTPVSDDLDEDHRSSSEYNYYYTPENQENEYRHIYDPEYWGEVGLRQEEEAEAHSPLARITRRVNTR